jgi:hypothetical protein
MKSTILLIISMLLLVSVTFGAYDPQYVSKVSGDTLFVKDDIAFGGYNTLYKLMVTDSLAPATRVYMLSAGGTYSCQNNPQSSKVYKTVITGPDQNIKKGTILPPVISGLYATGINTNGGMNCNKDLLVKNIDLEIGNSNGNGGGWAFFNFGGTGLKLQVDNCIMEHTWWCWVGGPSAMQTIKFTNDYFVNLSGHSCRRNGGVTDFNSGSANKQDTLLVENCTHVNIQGIIYKFRVGYTVNRAIFNHNDFINCSSSIIMNNGNSTNLSITNNIYVNCQLQAMCPVLLTSDVGEVDADGQAMGFINLRVDSTFTANVGVHGVYVDKNLTYWDPSLSDIVSTLNTKQVDKRTDWISNMVTMNPRTTALFANKTQYPKLTNGTWTTKLPAFVNTSNLFTTQLAVLKAFSLATVDTSYGSPLASWRKSTNPEASNFVYADFPIPIDLSYTDADLMVAGSGGFPLGDLNWFPAKLASWKAQSTAEYATIQGRVDGTLGVTTTNELPQGFQLQQNYPNPFNPSTEISYTISKAGNVSLNVYNMLGQQVASLVNGFQAANTYKVNFNASGLSSGVYFYKLSSGNNEIMKKMVLMK